MKKFHNDHNDMVRDALKGDVLGSREVALARDANVVALADIPSDPAYRPVAVISGGGAGHEPAHAGYVGHGMLTAAVAGPVFTSPDVDTILGTIRAVAGPAGALLVVKNYTGDRLNFGLAAELARAEGLPVEVVLVQDDVALRDRLPKDQARGVAGTVLVHKVAGAAVAQGLDLQAVTALARQAADGVASMGVALTSCVLPGSTKPNHELALDEIEFGLGIHGEAGRRKVKWMTVDKIVEELLDQITAYVPKGEPLALLINAMGGTSPLEVSLLVSRATEIALDRGLGVERVFAGEFMTSLDTLGMSLTLLTLTTDVRDALDAPTRAPKWRAGVVPSAGPQFSLDLGPVDQRHDGESTGREGVWTAVLDIVAQALVDATQELADLDSVAGDGDLGASMERMGKELRVLSAPPHLDVSQLVETVGRASRRALGGSSGPFYGTALLRAARAISPDAPDRSLLTALDAACEAITELGGAQPGDRTMLDALIGARDAVKKDGGRFPIHAAAKGARSGADATRNMLAKHGRARYLGEAVIGHADAGAVAVAIWMEALADACATCDLIE